MCERSARLKPGGYITYRLFEKIVDTPCVRDANRTNPKPKPKPIRPNQPMIGVSPFVSYTVCANHFLEHVVSSTENWRASRNDQTAVLMCGGWGLIFCQEASTYKDVNCRKHRSKERRIMAPFSGTVCDDATAALQSWRTSSEKSSIWSFFFFPCRDPFQR